LNADFDMPYKVNAVESQAVVGSAAGAGAGGGGGLRLRKSRSGQGAQ